MRELSILPGRVRFQCNKAYRNKELSKYIDSYTEGLYGVEYSRVNYNTGTILVLYDEAKTNLKLIKSSIEQTLSSEINYNDEAFSSHDSYYRTKEKKEIVKNNFIRSSLIYLFFKIKQFVFGKSFLSGSFAALEIASIVTIVGGYSLFRSIYNRSVRRIYPHPDVFLKLVGFILTISRESTEGLFLILLTDFTDYIKASADLKCECLLKKSLVRPPNTAWLITSNGSEILTSVKSLEIGDSILIHQGEVIPIDGEVIGGKAVVNSIYYTGQPFVSLIEESNKVYEGMIAISGELKVRVLNLANPLNKNDISIEKLHLREKIIRYQERALPIAIILSVLNYMFTGNILNALSIILVLCPASSELALGIGIKNYMHLLSKYNIYVKNPNTFEKVVNINSIVFDKTGTLTYKDMDIAYIESFDKNYTNKDLLKICTTCENGIYNKVPKASQSVLRESWDNSAEENLESSVLIPSKGISTEYNEHKILIGDADYLRQNSIVLDNILDKYLYYQNNLFNPMLISVDNSVVGLIVMQEIIREGACDLIKNLKFNGIKDVSLATGDHYEKGIYVANKLDIENIHANCSNEEKLKIILRQRSKGPVMMVGDGINDLLSMRAADVSVSFANYSSDDIKFNSDYVIFDDDISRVNDLIMLSRDAYRKIDQNIMMANLYNTFFGVLAFFGSFNPFVAKSIDTINSIFALVMNERIRLGPKRLN
ncbi:cation-translocating P-type ATPase [Clostridium sp. PL3]|uniref:Cd(2+)-exporting ATPase n=1 Tax=Clostridium thailandense TaxID=2794346 RepID=A0A949WX33_9CLOT|nr:HAD-IC family P-type ATPase [Clostridium thailandense]MBV7275497.1 cation-translocating P-type ATPase [Clostridium thailandense]